MKKQMKKSNINSNDKLGYLIVFIFTFLFSLFFYHNTFFYKSTILNIDFFVFSNLSYFIKRGLIVYKDFIDNKGPILHLFNFIAYNYEKYNSIYIMALIINFITNIYIYKISRIKLSIKNSIIVLILTNAFFISLLEEHKGSLTSTMCEFYAMPIFAYLYFKFLQIKYTSGKLKNIDMFVEGILFSILFFLRVNLVSISIILIILNIKNKKVNNLVNYILYFSLGALIIFIPVILYFVYNDAFYDFINSYILFNIKYSSVSVGESNVLFKIIKYLLSCAKTFFDFSKNIFILITLSIYTYFIYEKKKISDEIIIFIFCYFSAIFVSNRYYMHYIWILVPLITSAFLMMFDNEKIKTNYKIVFIITMFSSIFFYIYGLKHTFTDKIKDKGMSAIYNDAVNIVKDVKVNDNNTLLAATEHNTYFYKDTNLLPGSKYVYQFEQPFLYNEFVDEMNHKKPDIIIYEKVRYDNNILLNAYLKDLINNNYIKYSENNKYIIYRRR